VVNAAMLFVMSTAFPAASRSRHTAIGALAGRLLKVAVTVEFDPLTYAGFVLDPVGVVFEIGAFMLQSAPRRSTKTLSIQRSRPYVEILLGAAVRAQMNGALVNWQP